MNADHQMSTRRIGRRALLSLMVVLLGAGIAATAVLARSAAAPQNTALPTISGTPREGNTLTANNGTWTNSPTSYTYQWQRCDSGGASCTNITGANAKTYSVATADVEHTLRVIVTAVNADGSTPATSRANTVVSSAKGPVNTALPTISGVASVGQELSASNGTWTGGVQSYTYQWQRCDANGASCAAVVDATSKTYGVRLIDVGNTLRVVVTAKNASGSTGATSAATGVVTAVAGGGGVTTPSAGNTAPTVSFVSLKRTGVRIYVRFRSCDDGSRNITVIARDTKSGVVAATHRFSVVPDCGTHAKSWVLGSRFRHGRYTATLRAVDTAGKSSATRTRSLTFR
jgi:hypothetical protein